MTSTSIRTVNFTTLRLAALFLVTASCFTVVNASSSGSAAATSQAVPVPPFVQYLTEDDLNKARQLALDRHTQAIQDAFAHFPIDEVDCSARDDAQTVAEANLKQYPVVIRSKLPDHHSELPPAVSVSQKPILTREECAHIIQLADEHFAEHGINGEWTALPAGQYKMRGFQLKDIAEIRRFFIQVFRKRFLPLVRHVNPDFANEITDLALDNCYLMKFTPETGNRMDIHCDDGCLSFTIQMNPREQYVGGGTWFEGLAEGGGNDDGQQQQADDDNHSAGILKMDVGHVHFRPSAIRHCGHTISSGERYVIGGFAIHRDKPEIIRQLMRGNTEEEMDLALPAVVALNPEYDEGYAMLAHDWDVRQNRPDDAKQVLEYCLQKVNPRCSKVAFSLAVRHYRREGKHEKVMECIKIVLEYDPTDVDALSATAEAANALGKTEVEKEMYSRIVQVSCVDPERKANAYRDWGLLYKGSGYQNDLEFELDCYRNAIASYDNYHARYSLGRALFEKGELEQARENFLAAYVQDNTSIGALKAIYRTAKTIVAKDTNLDAPQQQQRLTELVGGSEIFNKIQSLMMKAATANPFGYRA